MYIGAWCCTENPDGVIAAEATCPFRGGYCYGPAALRCRPHSHTRTYPIHSVYTYVGEFHYEPCFITGRLHGSDASRLYASLLNLPAHLRTSETIKQLNPRD